MTYAEPNLMYIQQVALLKSRSIYDEQAVQNCCTSEMNRPGAATIFTASSGAYTNTLSWRRSGAK